MNIIDQLGRNITFSFPPKRIISVVPSQTELLFDLGLNDEVIGITKFCIHPAEWFADKTKVGGTKTLNIELIQQLQPDLIIANKEENEQAQIEELANQFPVWISDIKNLDDALKMIADVGTITNKTIASENLRQRIFENFQQLPQQFTARKKAAYLIWRKPYMTVNSDTFIHDILLRCGFENVFAQYTSRYPEISIEQLEATKPDIVLLSSEPYPFSEKHIEELKASAALKNTKVQLVDGEMFSWYGSRLIHSPEYFRREILNL